MSLDLCHLDCEFNQTDAGRCMLIDDGGCSGWIHTLLEEAENERMHLLTFLKLRDPGQFFRFMVLLGQVFLVILCELIRLNSWRD